MIEWILTELERQPDRLFYEQELKAEGTLAARLERAQIHVIPLPDPKVPAVNASGILNQP
ncbi:MAG: hypothetical protein ACLFPU_10925 [Dehalococcoidia bacterium]